MTADKKSTMSKAVGVARAVTEGVPDAETLGLVSAGLDTALALAVGELTGDGIDRQVAERMVELFAEVDPENGPEWLWELQQQVAEAVLSYLGDGAALALVRKVRWADATDAPEPWDGADADTPALPAPSAPLTPVQGLAYPATPASPSEAREGLWDNTDNDGSPAAEPDEDPADDDPEVIIDAEVIEEVGQTTSAQRRYKMPSGQHYAPRVDGFARRIGGGGRPQTVINTDSPHPGDQR